MYHWRSRSPSYLKGGAADTHGQARPRRPSMSALLCVSPCPGAVARGGVGGGSHTGMAGRHVSSSSSAARRRGPRERCGPQSTRAPDRAASPSQLKHCFESSYYEIYVIPTNGMHCLASESKFRDNKSRGGVERGACRPDGRRKLGLRNLKPHRPRPLPSQSLSLSRSLALFTLRLASETCCVEHRKEKIKRCPD